jgi:chemotaxis signal transduction protein
MNKLSSIIIGTLALGLVAAIAFGLYERKQRYKAETQTASTQKVVSQAAKIIDHYIDSSKRNHVVISADSNQLEEKWYKNGTAISGGIVDTVTAALNIAKKQLQEVTQIASQTKADKLQALKTIDSLKQVTYYYKDRYLQLAYRPARTGDTTDNGQFDFKYNDSLNVVQYWKKDWFLGSKKSYIDIYSNDPRTSINGVKRLVVKQEQPTFGLRVQAVSNYSFSRKVLNVGPGIQFDIKRFSLIGTYYYDTDLNQWRPSVGLRYDIIRF